MAEFREAVRLQPDYASPHDGLGNVLCALGRPAEAVDEYREALRLKPDFALTYGNLSYALRLQGKFDEAIAACRAALRLKADFPEARFSLALALRSRGEFAEAVDRDAQGPRPGPARIPTCRGGSASCWPRPSGKPRLAARLPAILAGETRARRRRRDGRLRPDLLQQGASAGPRRGSGPRRFGPSRSSPMTCRPTAATTPPAPRHWPVAAGARINRRSTKRPGPAGGGRPWNGSRPTWRRGRRPWKAGRPSRDSRSPGMLRALEGRPRSGRAARPGCTGQDPRGPAEGLPRPLGPGRRVAGQGRPEHLAVRPVVAGRATIRP